MTGNNFKNSYFTIGLLKQLIDNGDLIFTEEDINNYEKVGKNKDFLENLYSFVEDYIFSSAGVELPTIISYEDEYGNLHVVKGANYILPLIIKYEELRNRSEVMVHRLKFSSFEVMFLIGKTKEDCDKFNSCIDKFNSNFS